MKQYTSQEIKEFVSKPLFDEVVILNKKPSYPKISIVTPSYNQAKFLERTILSVLNQNYPNLEYIIIDGGSTDGSVEIIKKYEKHLTYWVSEKDKGQTHALNKGFLKSTGEILGWQNSDDIYLPGAFHTVAESFNRFKWADLIFGNTKRIDEQDNEIGELRFVPFSYLSLLYEGMMLNNQSAFWKRSFFFEIGMLDESFKFAMDYDFFERAGRKGRLKFIRKFLGAFRIHSRSKTSTINHVCAEEIAIIRNRIGIDEQPAIKKAILKKLSLGRRMLLYLLQGDLRYVGKGFNKRVFHQYV